MRAWEYTVYLSVPEYKSAHDMCQSMWECMFVWLLLCCAIVTVFQLYHSSDMMREMRRRKPEPTLLPTQGVFNLTHHTGMVCEELAFDDTASYTQWGNGLQHRYKWVCDSISGCVRVQTCVWQYKWGGGWEYMRVCDSTSGGVTV